MELEKDGWKQVDMHWCQSALNIGLSHHKLKSVVNCTTDHNAHPFWTDRQTVMLSLGLGLKTEFFGLGLGLES